ncbi:MAG: GNAT family N-acetyltransferase [Geminicoccaceae bacterium]
MQLAPSEIDVRRISAFEIGRLARLHAACFDEPWSRADLLQLLAMPGGFGLVAAIAERSLVRFGTQRLVGFALCRTVRDECELLSIGVVVDRRREGVATRLVARSIATCQAQGARRMFLEVAVDNASAQALYQGFGFVQIGRRESYYRRPNGTRMAALTMRLDFKTPRPRLVTHTHP